MADINVTLNPDLLPNLLSDDGEGMKKLVESVLNQVLEAQWPSIWGRIVMNDRVIGRAIGTGTENDN